MIPRRLKVKGFMSYREEVEIFFHGSTLWALLGRNGAGKSSLLDAMLFVLYGEHRLGGRGNYTSLIHHGASQFSIEFDFTVGADDYSVKRIVTRRAWNSHTTQARHLRGPNAPDPQRPGPQAIAGTEQVTGLKNWVMNLLGFDKDTFVCSVLLQQGRSEALLSADASDRHRMLTQIIDLSVYERLYKRASEYQRDLEKEGTRLTLQLNQIAPVDPTVLTTLQQDIEEAQKQKTAALGAQVQLATWKAQSERWQVLVGEQANIEQQIEQGNKLFEDAALIEQNATRQQTLMSVLPTLRDIVARRDERATKVHRLSGGRERLVSSQRLREQLTEQKSQQQLSIQKLEQDREELQTKQNALSEQMAEILPALQEIVALEKKQRQCETIQQQLTAIPEDLEMQLLQVQDDLRQVALLKQALPLLQQFSEARQNWQQALQQHVVLQQLRIRKGEEQDLARLHDTDLQDQRERQRRCMEEAQQMLTRQQTLHDERSKRLAQFHTIEHLPNCSYCGQRLTAEHIVRERARLVEEEQQTARQLEEAQQNHDSLQQEAHVLAERWKTSQQELLHLQETLTDIGQQEQRCINTKSKAEAQARTALKALPLAYAKRISKDVEESVAIECVFQEAFPTEQDMQEFHCSLKRAEQLSERERGLEKSLEQQRDLRSRHRLLLEELATLVICYPSERIQELRQRHRNVESEQRTFKQVLRNGAVQLKQQKQELEKTEEQQRDVEGQLGRLERQIAIMETQVQNLDDQLVEKQVALPPEWQAQSTEITDRRLADLGQELEQLEDATHMLALLTGARSNRLHLEAQREQLIQEWERIPVEARRPVAELEQAETQAQEQYRFFDERESQARTSKTSFETQQQQRDALLIQQKQAARKSALYKELAKLLGPDGLQHYLVQKAEVGIVHYANEELDRISAGALSLKLQPTEKAKAFELLACNREISATDWMPVKLLSGSQQFRVSVSLALGIGKYTNRDNRSMESVMIDEGFGSLDTQGRSDMVQVLKDLKDTLKCIIVISHQEEIFKEFDNKYLIELVDGSSSVTLD
jgi:exonuclease SbcC